MTLIPPSRRLGWLLSIYGLIGIVAAVAVLVASIVLGYQVARLRDAVTTQRQALISTLDSTTLLLGTVTTASGNIKTGLDSAAATIDQAASLADSAASASSSIAGFADFSIFGQKPFAGIGDAFTNIADQAGQIKTQLSTMSGSLTNVGGDLEAAVPALQEIQTKTEKAKAELQAADRLDDLPVLFGFGVVFIGIYLAWLGLTALAALWLGRRMLKMTKDGPVPAAAAAAAAPAAPPAIAAPTAVAPSAPIPAPAPAAPAITAPETSVIAAPPASEPPALPPAGPTA